MGVTLLLWVRTRWLLSTPAEAAARWAEGPGKAWVINCSQGTASWSLTGGDLTPTCIFTRVQCQQEVLNVDGLDALFQSYTFRRQPTTDQ